MFLFNLTVEEESSIKGAFPDIPKRVLDITLYRLQSGVMIQTIYQVLTKAEITIDMSIEDEQLPERLPSALLYRKVRQCVYGILFDLSSKKKKDDKFDPTSLSVKEWCVYGGRRLNDPDCVEPMALDWDVPPVDKLWFSKGATADSNRLKAFLSCMMSNTPSMTQTVIVPKRLVILCCILRYSKQFNELSFEIIAVMKATLAVMKGKLEKFGKESLEFFMLSFRYCQSNVHNSNDVKT